MSLRRRVLLGFLGVAVALVVTNVSLASAFERDLVNRVDDELAATATGPVLSRGQPTGELEPLSDLYLAIARRDGSGLVRLGRGFHEEQSPPALSQEELEARATAPMAVEPFTVSSQDGDASWRVVALTDRVEGGLLVVGTDLDQVEGTLRQMRLIQISGSAAVLVALGAVLWWVLRLGVRPLVAVAEAADDIAAGDLSRRVEQTEDGTEAARLGDAFNSMLAEIERAFSERSATEARLRQFAADASHELRTPLTSIRGYAELWEAGGLREPHELDEAMRRLGDEARRMGSLVEDLLLLARLDEQRPLEQRPVRLDLLAVDGVRDARAVEPDRPITIDAQPATVDGDEARLRQVVANLLANARVHTPPGTPVHVSVAADGGLVRLQVVDEGPGIAPEVAALVFDRFYRADSARSRTAGSSGLGLSIVDAVARAHGGRATVSSAPGAGSRFTVELPRAQSDPQPAPRELQGPPPTVGA